MDECDMVETCCDEVEMLETTSFCFMCDKRCKSIEKCMVHMHKHHGFFIPDIQYLKDPKGLLTFLSLKVKRDLMCLYCSPRCRAFESLEAVRKHMEAKSHCRVRYGDLISDEDEDGELEDFYDYSSSYIDVTGQQLVVSNEQNRVTLSCSELVITTKSESGVTLKKTIGSREFLRYYRQNPRPRQARDATIVASLASRYRRMGLITVEKKERLVTMKMIKQMNKSGIEGMRNKIGMKSNVIRNLPRNVPY